MEKGMGRIVAECIVIAAILTVISYFNGGVRYPFDDSVRFLPIWAQLLRNFAIYFVVFLGVNCLFQWFGKKFRKQKDK